MAKNISQNTVATIEQLDMTRTSVRFDRELTKEEDFGLGGLNMDGPITWARSKRFQEELGERLNSLIEEREEEVKLINFNQPLE